jgi:hypothetical protein
MANTNVVAGANVQITGTLDMRENPITGLNANVNEYPLSPSDGATKAYVDYQRSLIESQLPATANNGTY